MSSSGVGEDGKNGTQHELETVYFLIVLTTCPRVLVPVSFLDFEEARHTREYRFPHYLISGTHNIDVSPFGGALGKVVCCVAKVGLKTLVLR